MVTMLSLQRAALLSIQLLVLQSLVCAGIGTCYHRDQQVLRGESITITCNTSTENLTQIKWTKGRSVFVYSIINSWNSSNLTSDRLRIDLKEPLKLQISDVQPEDEGLYTCEATTIRGEIITEWNLTVSEGPENPEEPEAVGSWTSLLYILTFVTGSSLLIVTSLICLCRKLKTRTPNQNQDQNQDQVQDQPHLESGGEAAVRQTGTGRRTNHKRRSQYMERLNSIYGC